MAGRKIELMATLVINVPLRMALQQGKRSFEETIFTGIGDRFVISSNQLQQLGTGNELIVLDKDTQQRAEGTLVGLQPNDWTLDHKQRYDVFMQNMVLAQYQNVPLRRWGVSVID